ncbi:MAG: NADH-quinone oxidoreductase subunit J family protein [Planctomycetota bacterium]
MTPTVAYLIYFAFALLAGGTYFLLPRAVESRTRVGLFFSIAGIAMLIGVMIAHLPPDPGNVFFFLFATIAVVGAARVITHPVPVYSALYFVLVVVAVAAVLVLQGAEFTAMALIIVYAGAILVTYLFVIMLAQQEGAPIYDRNAREPFMAVLASFILMGAIAGKSDDLVTVDQPAAVTAASTVEEAATTRTTSSGIGNTRAMGNVVMTKYVVALELASVLLLISMVGAIAMSRKRVTTDGPFPERRPLGQIGKEVKPF